MGLMDVATLLSAETLSVTVLSATSSHHNANTMRIASLNKSLSAAAHTLASVTSPSVAISERLSAQRDTRLLSPLTSAAQLLSASHASTLPRLQLPTLLELQVPTHPPLRLHQLPHHVLPSPPLLNHQSVLIMKVSHDAMVSNGLSLSVRAAAVSLPETFNALSESAPSRSVPRVPSNAELTLSISVALLHSALRSQKRSAQSAQNMSAQLANATRTSSALQSMLTAAATSILANATRISASTSVRRLAQPDTDELLSIPTLAAQLLDAARSLSLQTLPSPLHALLPRLSPRLQSPTSLHSHHVLSVLTLLVASEPTVRAGLSRTTHALSTLAALSTISELPSENADTSELPARLPSASESTRSTNAALSTLVSQVTANTSSAQMLSQSASTTKT